MTFKTEKGQLAYQFLTGITICLWVWYFLLTVAVRTVEGEVVDWNIAVFPFNYDEETYKKLDNFE
ncbi:MAG: hypothetical protein IJW34_09530 [Clostridia bacterium]|nr:hypothetical protein [Clostridia bacterium]